MNDGLRVLQIHTRYRQAGGEDVVVQAERYLLESAGHEVEQHLVDNPVGPVAAGAALLGSAWNPAAARRVAVRRSAFEPDVVHVHNTWFALSPAAVAAARTHGAPVVMTVHNYRLLCANGLFLRDGRPCEDCVQHSFLNAVRHRCYRDNRVLSAVAAGGIALHDRLSTWTRVVDRFVVLSQFAKQRLVQAGYPAERIDVGGNFVPDPGPRPSSPSGCHSVVFVGRLSTEKGVATLLEAWRRASPTTLRLRVIGDGPLRESLEASAPNGVDFLGRVSHEEAVRHIGQSRALIVPSIWYEGQPMVALEALAQGTPAVVSRIGALPELLGELDAGWTVRPDDADDLARKLCDLEDRPAEADRRGALARRRYEQQFSPAVALERLVGLYARVRGSSGTGC